ncbi:hypothetical protein PI125_g22453 [Phytophthora idaei]|nr:hypothetical protein PI125_g22453 [Phytophthora idaei]
MWLQHLTLTMVHLAKKQKVMGWKLKRRAVKTQWRLL